MSKEVIVESFELDHTIVKAPYVRLIGEEIGPLVLQATHTSFLFPIYRGIHDFFS